MPLGFASITIVGFLLTSAGVPEVAIYSAIMVGLLAGTLVLYFRIPMIEMANNATTWGAFVGNMRDFWEWFPEIWKYSFSLMIDMLFLSMFSGTILILFLAIHNGVIPWRDLGGTRKNFTLPGTVLII